MRLISSSQKNLSAILIMPFSLAFAVEVEADGDVTFHLLHAQ